MYISLQQPFQWAALPQFTPHNLKIIMIIKKENTHTATYNVEKTWQNLDPFWYALGPTPWFVKSYTVIHMPIVPSFLSGISILTSNVFF